MNNIAQKIVAGVIKLEHVSTARLIEWASTTTSIIDRDILGTEIMYRPINHGGEMDWRRK